MAGSAESMRRTAALALCAALLFAATLWLDTRQNGFPYFYHPDEPDKVDQLITGKWNFHHPLLMLGTAELARKALGTPDREQALVEVGRWCSAVFAAGGVLGFAWLAARRGGGFEQKGAKDVVGLSRGGGGFEQKLAKETKGEGFGWGGFWAVGLLLATQHQVYELGHYFKEDTALFFAVAAAFVGLHVYHRRAGWGAALAAGAACGLCVSAKYLGAVMLVPAGVILGAAQRRNRGGGWDWGWFAAGFLVVVAAVNWPVAGHLNVFTHSLGRETDLVAHGERAYSGGGQVAIFEYLHIFLLNTTPMVWMLVVVELVAVWRRGDVFDWMMAVFPFALMLLLSCSTKTNDRYFLPATGGFYYLAGLGAMDLAGVLPTGWGRRSKPWLPWLAAGLALAVNGVFLAPYVVAFAHDDREEMLAWIRANVPADAVIAGENRADLPAPRREERLAVQPLLPQRVIETKYAADLGATPAAVAAQGIDYIVISESDYGIFFRKAATGHLSPEMERKREFYETLWSYQPVWQRDRGTGIYLHPGLRVYRLRGGG